MHGTAIQNTTVKYILFYFNKKIEFQHLNL